MTDSALTRYQHRLRRQRLVYFSVVAVIVLALAVVARIAWTHGEIAHTTLRTVSQAPADLRTSEPSTTQTLAWHADQKAAIGAPQWGGTVVVYGAHTVRGLNARTGAQTWSYTRTDRTVCNVAQVDGTTVALYELAGNCDEVTGLDSDTGARQWTRTLDEDGHPLFGHPQVQATSAPVESVVITTSSVIYSLDPSNGGQDHFFYARYGCAIRHAVLGSAGLLVSQNCTAVQCDKLKFCGRGAQLFLRSNVTMGKDDNSDTNPDRITWNRMDDADRPVSADAVVSAYSAAGTLELLDQAKGAEAGQVTLGHAGPVDGAVTAAPSIDAGPEIVWLDGRAYAVTSGESTPTWAVATSGAPTVTVPATAGAPDLGAVRIAVPASDGVRVLNGATGATVHAYRVTAPAAGATVYPLGAGFLVSASDGTTAYR